MKILGSGSGSLGNLLEAGGTSTNAFSPTQGGIAVSGITRDSSPPATTAESEHDTTQISSFAQLIDRIREMEKTDPARARKVLADVAIKLRAEAHASEIDAAQLGQLADKFKRAADSGDLSALTPAGHPSHHGRPGGGSKVQKAYAQNQTEAQSLLELLNTELGGR